MIMEHLRTAGYTSLELRVEAIHLGILWTDMMKKPRRIGENTQRSMAIGGELKKKGENEGKKKWWEDQCKRSSGNGS